MKRFLFILLFTSFLSSLFGITIFDFYKRSIDDTVEVLKNEETVYLLLYGSYNSKDKIDKLKLDNYFVKKSNNFYEVYVGISKNLENANKIRGIYKKNGESIYVRENIIDNMELLKYLDEKEKNIDKKSDEEILKIEKEIINKYKEFYE